MVTNMKILVFSDSHGRLGLMTDAIEKERPQRVFFLGDNYRDGQALADAYPDIPMELVRGNCDWDKAPDELIVEAPARVIEADERKATELALVENLLRVDLNPIEVARGYKTLMDEFGMTQDQAAQSVGKSRPAVTNALRLLSLSDAVLKMTESGEISAGHARALVPPQAAVPGP